MWFPELQLHHAWELVRNADLVPSDLGHRSLCVFTGSLVDSCAHSKLRCLAIEEVSRDQT